MKPPPEVYDGDEYVCYVSGDDIQLDGAFTADELVKIAEWLRNENARAITRVA